MKYIKLFEEFSLNESKKVDNIKDLEKMLPKLFKPEEYFTNFINYSSRFGSTLSIFNEIKMMDKNFDWDKFFISKGMYVNSYKEEYGDLTREEAAGYRDEYDRLLDDKEKMFKISFSYYGDEKSIKKITSLLNKSLGKLEASRQTLRRSYDRASDAYDRRLIMDNYFKSKLKSVWHDSEDVYYIKGVGSITTAMNTVRNSSLKEYIKSI